MTDREALAKVVDRVYYIETVDRFFDIEEANVNLRELRAALRLLKPAARERLAQLPEKCGTCLGEGIDHDFSPCPTCHGRGTVYPPALVERIAEAIDSVIQNSTSLAFMLLQDRKRFAVAVLDALNDWKPE